MRPVPTQRLPRIATFCLLIPVILAILTISSCTKSQPAGPNVVVIVIDTLRADHLPFYGYPKNTAPFISTLAKQGVVCEHTHSTSSWTAPATASIVTSLNPIQHGVLTGFQAVQVLQADDPTITLNKIPADVQTMAEAFQEAGYKTWSVTDNLNISRESAFDQGFDRFWNFNYMGAQNLNAQIVNRVEELKGDEPYLLYMQYMDPHRPYNPRPPLFKKQNTDLAHDISAYDSEIHYVDQKIRELYDLLGWDENTIIVVTSDHGEEFMDHGDWDHGRTLYGEVIDVPLVFYSSADSLAVGRISERVSVLDILPTLRDFVGLAPQATDAGVSLARALVGRGSVAADRTLYSDLRSPPWFESRVLKSVIRGDEKYILTLPDEEELYDLAGDPGEQSVVEDASGERTGALLDLLRVFEAECPKYTAETVETTIDPKLMKKLKSLGYVR